MRQIKGTQLRRTRFFFLPVKELSERVINCSGLLEGRGGGEAPKPRRCPESMTSFCPQPHLHCLIGRGKGVGSCFLQPHRAVTRSKWVGGRIIKIIIIIISVSLLAKTADPGLRQAEGTAKTRFGCSHWCGCWRQLFSPACTDS